LAAAVGVAPSVRVAAQARGASAAIVARVAMGATPARRSGLARRAAAAATAAAARVAMIGVEKYNGRRNGDTSASLTGADLRQLREQDVTLVVGVVSQTTRVAMTGTAGGWGARLPRGAERDEGPGNASAVSRQRHTAPGPSRGTPHYMYRASLQRRCSQLSETKTISHSLDS